MPRRNIIYKSGKISSPFMSPFSNRRAILNTRDLMVVHERILGAILHDTVQLVEIYQNSKKPTDDYEYIKIGIMPREEYQQRTKEIASGRLKPKHDDPRVWFSSIKAFEKALGAGEIAGLHSL